MHLNKPTIGANPESNCQCIGIKHLLVINHININVGTKQDMNYEFISINKLSKHNREPIISSIIRTHKEGCTGSKGVHFTDVFRIKY